MKSSTRHTFVLIGVALLILAGIMIYMSYSTPRVYVTPDSSTVEHSEYDEYAEYSKPYDTENVGLINLNTATVNELQLIDGIGEATALQIVSYRDELGGYTSVSQIKNIKGIGDSKYAKIAPYLTV